MKVRLLSFGLCPVVVLLVSVNAVASVPEEHDVPRRGNAGDIAPVPLPRTVDEHSNLQLLSLPEEVEVDGDRVPFGYVTVSSRRWWMVGLGFGAAVVAYVPTAVIAANMPGNAWTMTIPIVGPALQMGATVEHFKAEGGPGNGLVGYLAVGGYFLGLAVLTVGQVGGLALGTTGLFLKKERWIRSDLVLHETHSSSVRLGLQGSSMGLFGHF